MQKPDGTAYSREKAKLTSAGEIIRRIEELRREYERTLPCEPRYQEIADEISALNLKLQIIQKNSA